MDAKKEKSYFCSRFICVANFHKRGNGNAAFNFSVLANPAFEFHEIALFVFANPNFGPFA